MLRCVKEIREWTEPPILANLLTIPLETGKDRTIATFVGFHAGKVDSRYYTIVD